MVNLFYGNDVGYKCGVPQKLIKDGVVDFCISDYDPEYESVSMRDDMNRVKASLLGTDEKGIDEKILTVHPGDGIRNQYNQIIDINSLPALSKSLMEAMLPYESMAIFMGGIRRTNFPYIEYMDEKRNYLMHLRYWSYMFDKYEINCAYFENLPHTQHKWVIYGLCKVKNIPMLMASATTIQGIRPYGEDLFTCGQQIGEYYAKMQDANADEIVLTGAVKEFYETHEKTFEELISNQKVYKKQNSKDVKNEFFAAYLWPKSFLKYERQAFKTFLGSILKHHDIHRYINKKPELEKIRRNNYILKYYKKYLIDFIKDYDKKADLINYDEGYILFLPQLTPEETTIPKAGVFAEQYNSIQLIARAAEKNGLYVYVKEHFSACLRLKTFYEDLRSIKNVRLISTKESAYELMSRCVAVATQTGTCINEAVQLGKPALVTSSGYVWKGMPGLYEIEEENQGAEIIKNILDGKVSIDKNEVKKYYYAIQQSSIPYDFESPEHSYESASAVYQLVRGWLEKKKVGR
jgi:hypothetical protein